MALLPFLGLTTGHASAFDLNEGLLGITDPPFVVGDVLSDDQFSTLRCTESQNGIFVCPIRRYEDRMFAVMIDRSESTNRVTTALVFWPCDPAECDQVLKDTVSFYSETLGAEPEELRGTPIWKDRETSRRDLMVTKMGDSMISVMLVESDP